MADSGVQRDVNSPPVPRTLAITILLLVAGDSTSSARTPNDARWSKLTEPVFRVVAYSEGQLFPVNQGLPFTEVPTALAEDSEGFHERRSTTHARLHLKRCLPRRTSLGSRDDVVHRFVVSVDAPFLDQAAFDQR